MDYTTIWRFRDRLIEEGINDKLFDKIFGYKEAKNLLIQMETITDATIRRPHKTHSS